MNSLLSRLKTYKNATTFKSSNVKQITRSYYLILTYQGFRICTTTLGVLAEDMLSTRKICSCINAFVIEDYWKKVLKYEQIFIGHHESGKRNVC
jgi:hypothetical protein